MIHKYNAQDHSWLSNLYKIREKWSPAFNSDFFHGGVRSTSRSESTNHALNDISTKTISLFEFVLRFEKDLLEKWRRNEADADFFSSQSSPTLAVNSKLLKHGVRIYTNTMYKEFEKDYLNGTGALSCKEIPVGDTVYEFELTNSESNNDRVYTVFLDINTLKVECSCKKIHWMGMLCSHALAALHRKNVHEIPQEYIRNRWTKDVKKHAYIMDGYESTRIDDNETRVLYTSRTMRFAYDLVTQSESYKEARDIMWAVLKDGAKLLDEFFKKKNVDSSSSMKDKLVRNDIVELHNNKPILDPLKAKPTGTRNCRIKNHFEKRKSKIPRANTKRKTQKRVESKSPDAHILASTISDISTPSQSMNPGFIDVTRYQYVHLNSNSDHVNIPRQTSCMSKATNVGALTTQVPWSSTPLVEISTPSQSLDSTVSELAPYSMFGHVQEIQGQCPSFTWNMNSSQSFTSMLQSYNQINNPTQESSDWRSTTQ
ncbi:hypothetical protein BUALT_Bualt07G0008300 [Buddleja alternifolia]|uniref:Protein FAR1-RELATED SEQUENCE n=1 Tax=Buddleja alternifolia TaxID=168488 RepID=A0AAV6X6V9_9LAMI|nr:hypothetical protein BUALT_Bualt07G0008300 [Buddleja alternifolia]